MDFSLIPGWVSGAAAAIGGALAAKTSPSPIQIQFHSPVYAPPTVTPTVPPMIVSGTQSLPSSGILDTGAKLGDIMLGIGAIVFTYTIYDAWDDAALLTALRKEDCGGLSKMTRSVEACYRKYVDKAVHRTANGPEYSNYLKRFDTCFNNRPEIECSWEGWWNKDQIFEAGKYSPIDKQFLTKEV